MRSRTSLLAAVAGAVAGACAAAGAPPAPRSLLSKGTDFVSPTTGEAVLLRGANVVVKGAPWIPAVAGSTVCADRWWSNFTCAAPCPPVPTSPPPPPHPNPPPHPQATDSMTLL